MNKQELITRLIKLLEAPSEIEGSDFDHGHNYGIERAILLAEHLNEQQPQMNKQEKPVVPQFVADWYENNKYDFEYNLYRLCTLYTERKLFKELDEWFDNDNNKPIETLVLMHKFGYEIEKGKLYTVEIPNPNGFIHVVLCKDCDGKLFIDIFDNALWKELGKCKLTESEIKQEFGWAWQFAKEVQ